MQSYAQEHEIFHADAQNQLLGQCPFGNQSFTYFGTGQRTHTGAFRGGNISFAGKHEHTDSDDGASCSFSKINQLMALANDPFSGETFFGELLKNLGIQAVESARRVGINMNDPEIIRALDGIIDREDIELSTVQISETDASRAGEMVTAQIMRDNPDIFGTDSSVACNTAEQLDNMCGGELDPEYAGILGFRIMQLNQGITTPVAPVSAPALIN